MIICHSHRLVPYLAIIKEVPFSSRWEHMQRPTARHYVERTSKLEVSINPLPQNLGNPAEEDAERLDESEGMENTGRR